MDIDSVADELYGLAPEQFTHARNAYVKQAKQEGDRDLAASIQALSKPNTVAALANQLVRRHRDELAPLLELGESMRAATAALSGPQLRTLGQQRHRVIAALVETARATAQQDGRSVAGDAVRGLEETLHAALADEAAAEELMAGRLTDALHRSGLGGPTDGSPTPPPTPPRTRRPAGAPGRRPVSGGAGPGKSTANGPDALAEKRAERAQAQRDAAQARRNEAADDLAQAAAELVQAAADADERAAAVDRANATVTQLREELDRATAEQQRVEHAEKRLRAEVERAQRTVRIAQRLLDKLD